MHPCEMPARAKDGPGERVADEFVGRLVIEDLEASVARGADRVEPTGFG